MDISNWPTHLQWSIYVASGLLVIFLLFLVSRQVQLRLFYSRHLRTKINRSYYVTIDLKHESAHFEHPLSSIQPSVMLSFEIMQKHLSEKHWALFQEWIGKAQKGGLKPSDSISIYLNIRNKSIRRWIRFGYYSYDENNLRIKCSAENLYGTESNFYSIDPQQLTDLVEFISEVNALQQSTPHTGILLDLYNPQVPLLHQHYGTELANHYMMAVWAELDKLSTKQRIVSYQFGGHYFVYSHEGSSEHAIHELLNLVLQRCRKEFEIDRFRFPLQFQTGILKVITPIELTIATLNQVHQAAIVAKPLAYPITYVDYDSVNQEHLSASQHQANFAALIEKKTYRASFDPIYSIPSGMIHGYTVKMSALFEDKEYDMQGLARLANQFHLEKEFVISMGSEIATRYTRANLEPRHLFLYIPTDLFEIFSSNYSQMLNMSAVRITLMGDDLSSFSTLYRTRRLETIVTNLGSQNIRIGAKASSELATTYYPFSNYFNYLMLDELADNVETNVQKQWTIQAVITSFDGRHMMYYAPNVKSYEQAETLRNLGVGIQSGEFYSQLSGKKYSAAIRKFQRLLDIEGGQ